ncbi:MAG TPA: preprotein translocase subunit YajC [Pseudonocardiaceae bacterium]|nr:preprotein translocase subunit YajC [Pseudonocardiaceae bacterium]
MNFSTLLLPLIIVLFAVPLFMGTRKQKRNLAQQQNMQNSLSYGDRVMTTSGLYGTVVSTTDASIDIEVAPGVVTSWLRAAVREKVADSTVEGLSADDADDVYEDDDADEATTETVVEDSVPETTAQVAPPLEQSSKKAR